MKLTVFGTGAVGAYFGGRLAEAGEDVAFVARGQVLRAVREHGLRVRSTDGDFTIQPVRAADTHADLGPGRRLNGTAGPSAAASIGR